MQLQHERWGHEQPDQYHGSAMIYPIGGCSTRPIIHVAGAVAGAVADTDETYGA